MAEHIWACFLWIQKKGLALIVLPLSTAMVFFMRKGQDLSLRAFHESLQLIKGCCQSLLLFRSSKKSPDRSSPEKDEIFKPQQQPYLYAPQEPTAAAAVVPTPSAAVVPAPSAAVALAAAVVEFSFGELRAATDGFGAESIVSESGDKASNLVFKGTLANGSLVVVKKFPKISWPNLKQFAEEAKLGS